MNKYVRIALKTLLWIVGVVIFLVVLVLILIQVPAVQNFAKDKAVSFLQNKIKTKVQINRLSIDFPKMIVLEGVYFADQKGDTLIAGDKLKVDIAMFQLLHSKVVVDEINLEGITANVTRTPDSLYNYSYIMKAFMSQQKTEPKPADTTSTLKFSLDKVILDKINIKYKDAISGNNVKFLLGHFDTRIKDFDLDKMKFTIPKINLSGFDADISQPIGSAATAPTSAPDTATKPLNLTLNLGTIDLSKINVAYQGGEMKTKLNLGHLLVDMDNIDLKNQKVAIKNIQLENTNAMLALLKPQTVQKAVVKAIKKADTLMASPNSGKGWSLTLAKMAFVNDNVKFDNEAQKAMPKGIDFAHMDIRNLNADGQDIAYDATKIAGRINSFTFSDKSGLKVEKFHTTFLYGEKQSYLNDLYLQTPYTVLQDQVQIAYQSQDDMIKKLGELRVHANLNGSKLGLRDVLILMPTMSSMEPFKSSPNAAFKINGKVDGQVNNLALNNLEIIGLSNTHIKASAVMKGLPDMNKASFDVKINDFNTSAADINKLAPKGTIPSSVRVPSVINVKGTFKGGIKNFTTNLNLHTTSGNVTAIAGLNTSKGGMSYSADIKADNLNVGYLLKQEKNVGHVTAKVKVKGSGTNLKTAVATFSADVVAADVQGYHYHDLVASGTANKGIITTVAKMKDPNISFALDAKANMTKKYPAVNIKLDLDSINLQKLHFAKDDMRFHGKLIANVPTADPDYLNGNIKLTDIQVVNKGQIIHMDSVVVLATANADSSTLRLNTDMLTAHLAGKYKLTQIAPALQDVINKHFNMAPANAKAVKVKYSAQQFTFDAKLVKTPIFKQFVPDLKQIDPVIFKGSFDSQSGKLVVNGSAPKVVYGTNIVNNLKLNINTNNNALNYSVTADQIKASQVNLLYPSITGNAQNNKLNTSIQIRDAGKKERYRIAGVFSVNDGEYLFSFLQNGLLLDYTQWTVNSGNSLEFGAKGIMAKDFGISNANQTLSVNTSPQTYNGPLNIDFKNFKIETITKLADQSSLLVGGTINGDANIKGLDSKAIFTSNINVTDFNFKGDTVGNIALKVNNQTANAYAANVSITGKGNTVNLDGYYYTDKSSFDMNLNIVNLNLKSIEGFTFGNLKQSSGAINGQLKITGTTDAPAVRGDIHFDNIGTNITMINSYYKIPKETITFNDDGILFKDFTLVDSAGNKAIVAGTIYTKTYKDYKFGLDISADNFRVFNATQADNKLYFGQVFIDTRLKIRGDMNKPIVDGTLKVNDKTKLTVVLPQSDPGVEDRKGVVEFVDKNKIVADSVFKGKLDSLRRSNLTGLDVALNITVDKDADFTIVVDEANGDIVHVKGDTQLAFAIDPSGKTSLTGTFTVNEGSYDLSYLTVNRKFLFKQGSTITWQGDPTSATLDLTAIYIANVAPIDLVENQTDETQKTMLKQKLPFNVTLTLRGELLKPDITFGISLPTNTNYNVSADILSTVNNKLDQLRQDPNELNKQVFAVLLLGHFIGDNPLQSQAGGEGISGQVRSSVSSLLTDQLNQLAGNLIQGVDLNFALNSGTDYSSGVATNRTDLNVGLSKRFLNDRLTVSVGNNFNLEGQQANEKATNIAGDISIGYKLTKDGKYMIRAYRKDQYIVIQGQVVETGVGFSLTVDYNRFSQIFKGKSQKDKDLIKKQKEQDKEQKEKDKAVEQKKEEQQQQQAPVTTTN